jgi:DNA-binding transcriptional ArsR family regulator
MSNHSYTSDEVPSTECLQTSVNTDDVERVLEQRSDVALVAHTASLFSAMGDPTRLRLLEALALRELCVCDLAQLSSISQSGVSHQLRVLRSLGLVTFRRDGNRAVYRLADDHVRSLLDQGFEHAGEECGR